MEFILYIEIPIANVKLTKTKREQQLTQKHLIFKIQIK